MALFEHAVVRTLNAMRAVNCSLSVAQQGGTADGGVDFRGVWTFVRPDRTVQVIGQCKQSAKRMGATNHLRELEGVMASRPIDTVGILVHSAGFSRQTIQALHASWQPIMCVTVDGDAESVREIVVNTATMALLPLLVVGSTLSSAGAWRTPLLVWNSSAAVDLAS